MVFHPCRHASLYLSAQHYLLQHWLRPPPAQAWPVAVTCQWIGLVGALGVGELWSLTVGMVLPLARSPRVLTHGVHGRVCVCTLRHATAASGGLALCLAPEVRHKHRVARHCWCVVFHKHSFAGTARCVSTVSMSGLFWLDWWAAPVTVHAGNKKGLCQLQFCCWQSLYCAPHKGLQACAPHPKCLAGVGQHGAGTELSCVLESADG